MDVVFAFDTRPLESVTVAVNVIVPEVFKNPVVSVSAVPELSLIHIFIMNMSNDITVS